nr:hypothetical protein LSAT_5X41740 [Ipomoea trifida]
MSSIGFSYAHVHVQQERLKEKIRRSDRDGEERGNDTTRRPEFKEGKAAKKIHPVAAVPTQHNLQEKKA